MLTAEDGYLIGFYQLVRDQYINQTPMGVKGGPPVLVPRLEGYEAALRLYGYPRADWDWLISGAVMIHRLIYEQDRVIWHEEVPRLANALSPLAEVRPEDVREPG